MRKTGEFSSNNTGLYDALAFIKTFLADNKIGKNESNRVILDTEEALGSLISFAKPDSKIRLSAKIFLGSITLEFSSEGEEYDFLKENKSAHLLDDSEIKQDTIREMLLKAYADDIKYRHKNGMNYVRVTAVRSRHRFLFQTLFAFFLAIISGMLLSYLGITSLNTNLNKYLLSPVKGMFLNSLKIVMSPVVFFSIVTCLMRFSNFTELGRISAKVLISYLCTTVLAVSIGIGVFFLVSPAGNAPALAFNSSVKPVAEEPLQDMLLNTITGIVPSNFIKPFLDSNMLQLIFLAVICGGALGMIGKYSQVLQNLLEACNDLFLKITTIFMRFMPIAVFCSITSLILSLGVDRLLSVLSLIGLFLIGILCMIIAYCSILLFVGKLNPFTFIKKYFPTMLQVFSTASSNASIPLNMEACEKKLGIDRKICSFSIPLGATINMDGSSILLAVFSLSLAKMFGIQVSSAAIVSLAISIVLLSIGAPGVPGSMIICLSALLSLLKVPAEAISIVMGIGPLVGMFVCMCNCLGDVVVTTIVAKSEHLVDIKYWKETE
ncbi:dicarboxylate/amino acid:cation symporter [uncultured Treponema sp.]|uniref:dicarboxylate/amino acid:cation symporter n=1 Tax=uncultured Treponema sp. TaxID=162155 RepID=UPI002600C89C|nr:dicarboxylate/amino acid:cation symporter [uncultured Treponema sp.]